jgi:hypothetical protein
MRRSHVTSNKKIITLPVHTLIEMVKKRQRELNLLIDNIKNVKTSANNREAFREPKKHTD